MHNQIIIIILFLLSLPLFSMEIILKTDEGYICDFIYEDERYIKIKFMEKIYEIPKKEIEYRDDKKTGAHKGYKLSRVRLSDGSILKGLLAEENQDSLTLQTRFGFLKLEKATVKNIDRPEQKEYFPDPDYLEKSYQATKTIFGVSGILLGAIPTNPNSGKSIDGGAVYVEPSFLDLNSRWKFGLRAEYLVLGGKEWVEFANFAPYIQRKLKYSDKLDFYLNFGVGGVYTRYHAGSQLLAEGLNPSILTEFGWQGLRFGKFGLRMGLRQFVSLENRTTGGLGFEIGVYYNL